MKKFIVFILVLALVVPLAACGGRDAFKVDLFVHNLADESAARLIALVEENLRGAGLSDVEFEIHDAGGDLGKQIDQIRTACEAGSRMIAISMVSTKDGANLVTQTSTVIQIAKDFDIPVMFFDREPTSNASIKGYAGQAIYVGPSAADAAKAQAQQIFDLLKNDYDRIDRDGDGKITYLQLVTSPTSFESKGYLTVADEVNRLLKDAGLGQLVYYDEKNTKLYDDCTNGMRSEASRAINSILTATPLTKEKSLELVIATTYDLSLGAADALSPDARALYFPIFGIDDTHKDSAIDLLSGLVRRDTNALAKRIVDVILLVKDGTDMADIPATFDEFDEQEPYYIRTPYIASLNQSV